MTAQFRTYTGEIVTGARLTEAYDKVADWWAENARAVYAENAYASHVTEEQKQANLTSSLEIAERIRQGTEHVGFSLWQRINNELTGECIAFLP